MELVHSGTMRPTARRSSRVLVALPLAVSGRKRDGSDVSGSAQTILVNLHGAKIRSGAPLETGMELRVAMLAPYQWRIGQVVWAGLGDRVGGREGTDEKEYGIELSRPENFWGIRFPPQDWALGAQSEAALAHETDASSVPNALKEPADVSAPHSPLIPGGGTIAVLRGVTASGLPFQERDLILPAGHRHASMLIGPALELGATMRVIFGKNQVEKASVSAVSRRREFGRWRTWLHFFRAVAAIQAN